MNASDQYEELAELVRRVKTLPPMTEAERNEQRADWAYGNLACMSRYANATPEELEALRQLCREVAGCVDVSVPS